MSKQNEALIIDFLARLQSEEFFYNWLESNPVTPEQKETDKSDDLTY